MIDRKVLTLPHQNMWFADELTNFIFQQMIKDIELRGAELETEQEKIRDTMESSQDTLWNTATENYKVYETWGFLGQNVRSVCTFWLRRKSKNSSY